MVSSYVICYTLHVLKGVFSSILFKRIWDSNCSILALEFSSSMLFFLSLLIWEPIISFFFLRDSFKVLFSYLTLSISSLRWSLFSIRVFNLDPISFLSAFTFKKSDLKLENCSSASASLSINHCRNPQTFLYVSSLS